MYKVCPGHKPVELQYKYASSRREREREREREFMNLRFSQITSFGVPKP